MVMQETVSSIRIYFGLIGLFGLIRGVFGIFVSLQDPAIIIPASISLLFGGGYLYSSIKFPMLLQTSTKFVLTLLYLTMGLSAVSIVFTLVLGMSGADLIIPSLYIMVAWYLLLNVKRLEEEHKFEL